MRLDVERTLVVLGLPLKVKADDGPPLVVVEIITEIERLLLELVETPALLTIEPERLDDVGAVVLIEMELDLLLGELGDPLLVELEDRLITIIGLDKERLMLESCDPPADELEERLELAVDEIGLDELEGASPVELVILILELGIEDAKPLESDLLLMVDNGAPAAFKLEERLGLETTVELARKVLEDDDITVVEVEVAAALDRPVLDATDPEPVELEDLLNVVAEIELERAEPEEGDLTLLEVELRAILDRLVLDAADLGPLEVGDRLELDTRMELDLLRLDAPDPAPPEMDRRADDAADPAPLELEDLPEVDVEVEVRLG